MQKIKYYLYIGCSLIIAFLCVLLHIKTNKIKGLKAEVKTKEKESDMQKFAIDKEREIKSELDKIKAQTDKEVHTRYTDLFK